MTKEQLSRGAALLETIRELDKDLERLEHTYGEDFTVRLKLPSVDRDGYYVEIPKDISDTVVGIVLEKYRQMRDNAQKKFDAL